MARHRIPAAATAVVLLGSAWGCGDVVAPAAAPDVTDRVERLGNPFATPSVFARNVWDMQTFGGRVWLGHGNSIDNTGPAPIWSLDPARGRFAREFTTGDEQVDVFRVLGGVLHVPGHDPREGTALGNFYRLEGGGWVKHRTIPHALHTFDLFLRGGRLFAALGAAGQPGHETAMASDDGGRTWTAVTDELARIHTFFELSGRLYAAPLFYSDPDSAHRVLLRYDGGRFVRTTLSGATLTPALRAGRGGRMIRPVEFGGALVYAIARRDFDWFPVALAVARTLDDVRVVPLPDPAAVPYDFLVRGGTLHVLAAAAVEGGGHTVYVYATDDLARWRELFRFRAGTFARSFEEVGGDFYFGLGSLYTAPHPATGDILRVRRASWAGG